MSTQAAYTTDSLNAEKAWKFNGSETEPQILPLRPNTIKGLAGFPNHRRSLSHPIRSFCSPPASAAFVLKVKAGHARTLSSQRHPGGHHAQAFSLAAVQHEERNQMPDVYIFQSGPREVYFFTADRNANLSSVALHSRREHQPRRTTHRRQQRRYVRRIARDGFYLQRGAFRFEVRPNVAPPG